MSDLRGVRVGRPDQEVEWWLRCARQCSKPTQEAANWWRAEVRHAQARSGCVRNVPTQALGTVALNRVVEAIAISVLVFSHEECSELIAAPFLNIERAWLGAAVGEFLVQRIQMIDQKCQ